MSNPLRILLHNDETADLADKLRTRFPAIDVAECNSYTALPSALTSFRPDAVYSVRFAGTAGFPRDALFTSDGPRWVANGGSGTDHFGQWDPARTTVTNAAGVAADMMAEYMFGGFLHFTLDIAGMQSEKAHKVWASRRVQPMQGKTLLILGLGHTGSAIAKRAKAFGMQTIGIRARPQPMPDIDAVYAATDLDRLLPEADFIAVATPLTPATKAMLGPAQFAVMKPGVMIADVSRGGVVDQTALVAALRSGKVGAAVLDVFETEPLPGHNPLWEMENVIISPHCSSVYEGWEAASFDLFLSNLTRWVAGEKLINIVDPNRGY